MTQSAQPGATPAPEPGKVGGAATLASSTWVAVSAQIGMLRDQRSLLRPTLAMLAVPPVLSALASLFAQRVELRWTPALLTLLASALTLVAIGALPPTGRLRGARVWMDLWRPASAGTAPPLSAHDRFAARLGVALLALAALCATPIAFSQARAAWLLIGMGAAVVFLYGFAGARKSIAPLDEMIAALCLGPGLVALTVWAQGQPMSGQDSLIAIAFGCMALVVIEGRRLLGSDATQEQGRRTLVRLIGARGAALAVLVALLLGFALTVVLSVARPGLPGALLALTALPLSLVGLSGLAISVYPPARRTAAAQLAQAYSWFGLALAAGIVVTVIAQGFIGAVVHALGG